MRSSFWNYANKLNARQIGKKGLSREESVELGKLAEAGDEQAKERLFNSALRLVTVLARGEQRKLAKGICLTPDDLIQAGRDGLLTAIEEYDYRRNCKFSVVAYIWISQRIKRFIAENVQTVKIPQGQICDFNKFYKISNKFFAEVGRWPNTEEIAEIAGVNEEFVAKVVKIFSNYVVYLSDFTAGPNESQSFEDICEKLTASQAENSFDLELSEKMQASLAGLTTAELEIINYRYFYEELTLLEISEIFELPYQKVRKLHASALKKIKNILTSKTD